MALTREQIVEHLIAIVGTDRVITDEQTLKDSSYDRFRKLQSIFQIYPLPIPAAVVKVKDKQQTSQVLALLNKHNINCVPRTGASATEGGLETIVANSVVLDGSDMKNIISIDSCNMQATAECGVCLEDLENKAREQGLTTGHSPQSKPLAQMGGLVATRSTGQLSTLYGGIEDMVVGIEAVFPNGHIAKIKDVPRRACGPDIRHIIIGNEGALCFITEVTVRLYQYTPENYHYRGYRLDDMATGFEILREVMVSGYRPAVARLYDAEDGAQHRFNKFAPDQCVLIFVTDGSKIMSLATANGIDEIIARYKQCQPVDAKIIETWFTNLNWGPEKVAAERDYIRKHMNMGFTTEISGNWSCINTIYENSIRRIRQEFPRAKDITMLGGHSSHSYQTGTNVYFVYDYTVTDCNPEDEINLYHIPINAIIVEEALKAGGSMVHHHGIGKYRTPWTKQEHGSAYYMLEGLKQLFDPNGIMNKGTIYPIE